MAEDALHTAGADRGEPDDHHRPEQATDRGRTVALNREQHQDDHRGDRDDPFGEGRLDDLETFHRRQHRHRGGDHAVAEEQRGTKDTQRRQRRQGATAVSPAPTTQQRDERHDAAFAVVIGVHHQGDVSQRDNDHHRPEDHRHGTVDVAGGEWHGVRVVRVENRLDGVDRAGPDVAEHDAEGADYDGQANRFSACWAADRTYRRRGVGICMHGRVLVGRKAPFRRLNWVRCKGTRYRSHPRAA